MSDPAIPVRIDVWLWRARFFKTRALACRFVEAGRVRLSRAGQDTRLDKPSRTVRPGDALTFAIGDRVHTVRVEGTGERRGPASEAQELYTRLDSLFLDTRGAPSDCTARSSPRAESS